MNSLPNNWFYNGNLDFEYKKYLLLAYLQYVNRHFKDTKLYPALGDLVAHYRTLNHYIENKQKLDNGFPKLIEGIDLKRLQVMYKKVLEDENVLETIERLVRFSVPMIKSYLENGKEIYEWIENQLELNPIGVIPIRKEEGYLILTNHKSNHLVYAYEMSIYSNAGDQYRSLSTQFVKSFKQSISNTYQNIKYDLIRSYKHLPNPATYAVRADLRLPMRETFLPLAKKMLVAHLAANH